ncbi:tetratricopeptide repeat protein [Erythrobacter jejuensis]|uniref:Tetratricopeptide repeat protein n=1 Tax=Parerythrobacter jejuensis TaxID=795812 RepID=A0A845AQH3_9SPHN|nr:tetratricopeptide repeat protein [Parerythrobacter jejuensis]
MAKSDEDKKAQKKAAEDEALLREVDDAVRQDQYETFGKTYGRPLAAALVLGLAGFGGYLWWDSQQQAAMEQDSEVLISALDQIEAGNLETASDTLQPLVESDNDAARSAALLMQGGSASERGDAAAAARLFGQVSTDTNAPQPYRDLATIRMVAVEFDTLDPEQVITRLKPIAVPDNAFFGSAGELVAMAYLEQGKRDEAGALFSAIAKDDETPSSLRSRARQMAGMLGVDAIEDVDEVLEEVGADTGAAPAAGQAAAQ